MTLIPACLLGFLVLLLIWLALTTLAARIVMRRPAPDPVNPPDRYGLPYEAVAFPSRDGTPLVGWWIPATSPAGTIIVCHGQSGSMDGDTQYAPALVRAGFNVLMFDFRAHGRSGGDILTMGMFEKEDLLGALDYLTARLGGGKIGVLGFSMGAATALIAATLSDRIGAVVADASFGRLKHSMARVMRRRGVPFALGWQFAAWMLVAAGVRTRGRIDQVDPMLWVPHVRCPILFVHTASDPLVTLAEVQEMASRVGGPAEVWIAAGADHRGAYEADPAEYERHVIGWFRRHLG